MFASSGQAQLAFEITGVSGGADVLFLHAGVNDRRSWQHVARRLGERHRCVGFDQRGYGGTRYEPEDGWSAVADAIAVLDAAGMDRAVLVACSIGGQTAIDLALAHPERVAGLVLIGAAIRGAPPVEAATDPEAKLEALLDQAESAEDLEQVGRWDAWLWLDGPAAPEGRVTGAVRELFLEMNDRALRAEDPGPQAELPAAWPRLSEIAVPALVMVGTLDVTRIRWLGEQAADTMQNARFRFLGGVAHVPHLEADAATLDEISAFVDALA